MPKEKYYYMLGRQLIRGDAARYYTFPGFDGPSLAGQRKNPETHGWYMANGWDWAEPCTCKDSCGICRGECGCAACSQAYNDFGYG